MNPYNENARCPKCGGDTIGSRFCSGQYPSHGYYDPPHEGTEAIHRACARCGFSWSEAPIDKRGENLK